MDTPPPRPAPLDHPYAQAAPPPGQAPSPPGPATENPQARRLVNLSHVLGWGGIAVLILVAPMVGVATGSAVLGFFLGALGLASAIAGAILGQIGRAMQGRVI